MTTEPICGFRHLHREEHVRCAPRPGAAAPRRLRGVLTLLAALAISGPALAGPPSEASVEKLLVVTKSEALFEGMYAQLEQNIRAGMMAATQGRQLTAEQRKLLDLAPAKLVATFREELNWAKLKPQYVQVYREVLDQSEVDGMLAFYATPAGKATIEKMPAIMQRSMSISQEMLQRMLPRISAAMKDALNEAGIKPQGM